MSGTLGPLQSSVLYQLVKTIHAALGVPVPRSMRAAGGKCRSGVGGAPGKKILVDQVLQTERNIRERRPDVVVRLAKERRVVIADVACTLDHLVREREKKWAKYQEDLAKQWGYKVVVVPVVLGDLGRVTRLVHYLNQTKLF